MTGLTDIFASKINLVEYNLIVLDVRSSQERIVRRLHVFIEFLVGISSNNDAVTQKSQDTLIATRSICKTAVLMPCVVLVFMI